MVAALEARLEEAARPVDAPYAACEEPPGGSDALDTTLASVSDRPTGPEFRVRADRAHAVFRGQVRAALEEIADGGLEKVVLARALRVEHDGRFDVPAFMDRLRGIYPSCVLVAMGRGADTFLAATPETLVRLEGDCVETAALAGSAPRGRTPEEDRQLGEALLASPKDRAEHAHVVDALRAALEPVCETLEVPLAPELRALFGIQHLETEIRGRLAPLQTEPSSDSRAAASRVLGLLAALHPTPAVGGVPAESARAWLRRAEGLDRGWYAAPIGWIDGQGGGDFRVALRSGLIRNAPETKGASRPGGDATGIGSRAWLFAGAGIVAGSVPDQELAETRIKLRALLAPLTEI